MSNSFYAAADCGTNSFHMVVVHMKADGSFGIAVREKEIIRLGNNDNNIISAEAIRKSILTLHRFKEAAESFNAPLAVVATSAVRNSQNKAEFLEKVKKMTGISVKILSGKEEAKLTYLGVSQAIATLKNTMCIDIGGGSTEFIIGRGKDILFSKSLETGAVKLSRKYFNEDYSCTEKQINEAYDSTRKEISKIKPEIDKYNIEQIVGASGTIISTASMVTGGNPDLNRYLLRREEVKKISETVFQLRTVEERKSVRGLEPARADIIPAGLIILKSILEIFNIGEMIISLFGLREGVIVDTFLKKN